MPQNKHPFVGSGLFAIEPKAFGMLFAIEPPPEPRPLPEANAVVVEVRGPLTCNGWLTQSYNAIKGAIGAAFATEFETVILKIASPGGDVAGAFDCAREIRRLAEESSKRLIAFTEAIAASSAYALASAADMIVASDTAQLGSIGVIATALDSTKRDAAEGFRFAVVASGARKTDGNPHVSLTDDAIDAMARSADQMAGVFFELVAKHRGLTPQAIEELEAGVFVGTDAKAKGLVDEIMGWDELLRRVTRGEFGDTIRSQEAASQAAQGSTMSLRESLKKAADEGDEKAKRALKAYDEEEKPKAEAEDDDEKAKTAEDEKDEAKAEDEADDKDAKAEDDDEKKKEEARAGSSATAAASASVETDLAATVQRMNAELESFKAKAAAQERAEFMATRPDLAPDLVKSLAKLPLERAKEIVATIPKAFSPKTVDPAASAARGAGQDGNDDGAAARPNDDLDREMGLADLKPQAHYDAKSGVFTLGMRAAEAK